MDNSPEFQTARFVDWSSPFDTLKIFWVSGIVLPTIEKWWIDYAMLSKRFCNCHQVPMRAWNTSPIKMQSQIDLLFETLIIIGRIADKALKIRLHQADAIAQVHGSSGNTPNLAVDATAIVRGVELRFNYSCIEYSISVVTDTTVRKMNGGRQRIKS